MAAENEAVIVLSVDRRKLNSELNQAKGRFTKFSGTIQKKFRSVGSTLKTALAFGGVGAGVGGILAAGKQVFDFEKSLLRLGINAKKQGPYLEGFRKQIFDIAKETGADPDKLLGAARKYHEKTGDLDSFREGMDGIAKAALGTGTKLEDAGLLSAELFRQFGIQGKANIVEAFGVLQNGASQGAVELKDLATELTAIAPLFGSVFKRKGVGGLKELSNVMQVTEKGFGGAAAAATGVKDAMVQILKSKEKLLSEGIDVEKLGLAGTLAMLNQRAGGSAKKLKELMGNRLSQGLLRSVIEFGNEGAVKFDELQKNVDGTKIAMSAYGRVQDSAAGKIARAKAQLKDAFSKALVDNIDDITSAVESLAKGLSWMAENKEIVAIIASLMALGKVWAGIKGVGGIAGIIASAGKGAAAGAGANAAAAAGSGGGSAAAGGLAGAASRFFAPAAIAGMTLVPSDQGPGATERALKLKNKEAQESFARGLKDAERGNPSAITESGPFISAPGFKRSSDVNAYEAGYRAGQKRAAAIAARTRSEGTTVPAGDDPIGLTLKDKEDSLAATMKREKQRMLEKAVSSREAHQRQQKQLVDITLSFKDERMQKILTAQQTIRRRK